MKIVLLAYTRGVISSRRIERLCRENMIFKALSTSTEPDFTTITGFSRSMQDIVQSIFTDILLYCSELNLLGGTTFALDGCKMSSNASKEHSGTFADLRKKREKLSATVRFLAREQRNNDMKNRESRTRERTRITRMGIIELVFAHLRSAKGLDRFTLRDRKKVNVQWVLYCMVHNIEKIFRYG